MDDRDTERTAPAESGFVARWSRRKQAAAAGQPLPDAPPVAPPVPAATPVAAEDHAVQDLPDPTTLDFADDFTAYLKTRVPAAMKRAAMKRLFSDPSFNRMDGLDVYIEDFNQIGDLPAAEAALLAHAKDVLAPSPARRLADLVASGGDGTSDAAEAVAAAEDAMSDAAPAESAVDTHSQAVASLASPDATAEPTPDA